MIANGLYDYVNNKIFYWKNTDYSSHVLHPFMYNLKMWNKLNNIIVNGYKDYASDQLIDIMSSKVDFDRLFGKFGEGRNFWRYNINDLSGYTTRYEASIKNEHIDDDYDTISPLTGYDGLFYPDAARDFIELYEQSDDFKFSEKFFTGKLCEINDENELQWEAGTSEFMKAIYSIYWQVDDYPFYTKWYSHLNYTRLEYHRIAIQLWYWRDRIYELITHNYPITKYCLDIQGNSLVLVSTFGDGSDYVLGEQDDQPNYKETESNQYLIDLTVA